MIEYKRKYRLPKHINTAHMHVLLRQTKCIPISPGNPGLGFFKTITHYVIRCKKIIIIL